MALKYGLSYLVIPGSHVEKNALWRSLFALWWPQHVSGRSLVRPGGPNFGHTIRWYVPVAPTSASRKLFDAWYTSLYNDRIMLAYGVSCTVVPNLLQGILLV